MTMKKVTILKSVLAVLIVLSALAFEHVVGNRTFIILGLLLAFVAVNHLKYKLDNLILMGLLIEVFLIFFLENQSRYIINYFLHTLYILVLADAAFALPLKQAVGVQVVGLLVSNYKYFVLLGFENTFANVTQFGFFLMINILIAASLDFLVTSRKQKGETDQLYRELLKSQDQLEVMATAEERNRIAREIHDSLGHDMTGLIMQMEMVNHLIDQNPEGAKDMLTGAIESGRNSLNAVRRVVETLKNESYDLEEMVRSFSDKTGIRVTCMSCQINGLDEAIRKTLYRVVQEALTNALKHGEASEIEIDIKIDQDMIRFNIKDNGRGTDLIEMGFGLKSMTKRIESVGGKIHFSSNDGFEITGHIVRAYD